MTLGCWGQITYTPECWGVIKDTAVAIMLTSDVVELDATQWLPAIRGAAS